MHVMQSLIFSFFFLKLYSLLLLDVYHQSKMNCLSFNAHSSCYSFFVRVRVIIIVPGWNTKAEQIVDPSRTHLVFFVLLNLCFSVQFVILIVTRRVLLLKELFILPMAMIVLFFFRNTQDLTFLCCLLSLLSLKLCHQRIRNCFPFLSICGIVHVTQSLIFCVVCYHYCHSTCATRGEGIFYPSNAHCSCHSIFDFLCSV